MTDEIHPTTEDYMVAKRLGIDVVDVTTTRIAMNVLGEAGRRQGLLAFNRTVAATSSVPRVAQHARQQAARMEAAEARRHRHHRRAGGAS